MTPESDVLSLPVLEGGAAEPAALHRLHPDSRRDLSRLAAGLGLSAAYGLALGAHAGGTALLRHALGAPLGLLVVAAVAAPSLFVRLALIDAPLRPTQMLAAVARGTQAAGLVLAGLAPAAAMLVVSIESAGAAAWLASMGLWLAGGIGLINLFAALDGYMKSATLKMRSRAWLSVGVFALLSCALAARTWQAWLPLLGGGQ